MFDVEPSHEQLYISFDLSYRVGPKKHEFISFPANAHVFFSVTTVVQLMAGKLLSAINR
jgi:hypothetical protein